MYIKRNSVLTSLKMFPNFERTKVKITVLQEYDPLFTTNNLLQDRRL